MERYTYLWIFKNHFLFFNYKAYSWIKRLKILYILPKLIYNQCNPKVSAFFFVEVEMLTRQKWGGESTPKWEVWLIRVLLWQESGSNCSPPAHCRFSHDCGTSCFLVKLRLTQKHTIWYLFFLFSSLTFHFILAPCWYILPKCEQQQKWC